MRTMKLVPESQLGNAQSDRSCPFERGHTVQKEIEIWRSTSFGEGKRAQIEELSAADPRIYGIRGKLSEKGGPNEVP